MAVPATDPASSTTGAISFVPQNAALPLIRESWPGSRQYKLIVNHGEPIQVELSEDLKLYFIHSVIEWMEDVSRKIAYSCT